MLTLTGSKRLYTRDSSAKMISAVMPFGRVPLVAAGFTRSLMALVLAVLANGCRADDVSINVAGARADVPGQEAAIKTGSLAEAIEIVRKDGKQRTSPVTYNINLPAEAQILDQPLVISGLEQAAGSRVIITGAAGGTSISGAAFVEKYLKPTRTGNGRYEYALPLSDLPGDVAHKLLRKLASVSPRQLMIRANGKKVLRSTRWPNSGFLPVIEIADGPVNSAAIMSFADLPDGVRRSPDLWFGGYLTDSYLFVNARALAVNSRGVQTDRHRLRADGKPPERVFFYNVATFAQCNSFFYDAATRTLNFCSEDPIKTLEVPVLDTLLTVSGSRNLTVRDVVFELAIGTAVTVRESSTINFSNIILQLAGADGITYANSNDCRIDHASIRWVGGRGAWLSGGDRASLTPGRISIEDSSIQDFSLIYRTFSPAVQMDGVEMSVRRTVIFNGPQFGILYSGNDHVIEDNLMVQLLTEAGDSGFIYSARDFTSQGTIIRRNILLGTGGQYFNDARGIYLDEFSSGNLVTDNVIVGIPYGILMNGGKDNKLLSNLFVLSSPSIWSAALGYASWWQVWRNDHMQVPNGLSVRNLYSLPVAKEPWASRYPELAGYKGSDLLRPERNLIEGNKFVGAGSITASDGNIPTAEVRNNSAVVYRGSLQLLERMRNWIAPAQLDETLALVSSELDRHGLTERIPLRGPDRAGAQLPGDRPATLSEFR
ncbi:right-handed parallel beta-helix repeat-containing protein [Bradyrhizobium japonicum]|uniref:right-handed parallel beta-helix repeat-containing protein n=1 Tax=Bradyrhizobium japonicum TaxID=375 RepID=UPI00041E2E2F|nr:right-handed parallel beta-helix repeat-containing protein [Bradyrhizobium japonicum]